MDDHRLRLRDRQRGGQQARPRHTGEKTESELRWCGRCRQEIRWFPILADHDAGCPVLNLKASTDVEKAAQLAVMFDGLADHWPEAAEAARLLRRVKK